MVKRIKVFLASSSELKADREQFEILIARKSNDSFGRDVVLQLVLWEDFLDALSKTRLQDEYNAKIRECDLFVLLFWTKVGRYTEEEFETAVGQFKKTNRPFIYTYFKGAPGDPAVQGAVDPSVASFQRKLGAFGHFYTVYQNTDALKLHFTQQLERLWTAGFAELNPADVAAPVPGVKTVLAQINVAGVVAHGAGATAVGVNTGTIISIYGIQALPATYKARIRRFLQAYLGDEDSPILFGGRDAELALLNDWLEDPGRAAQPAADRAGRVRQERAAGALAAGPGRRTLEGGIHPDLGALRDQPPRRVLRRARLGNRRRAGPAPPGAGGRPAAVLPRQGDRAARRLGE